MSHYAVPSDSSLPECCGSPGSLQSRWASCENSWRMPFMDSAPCLKASLTPQIGTLTEPYGQPGVMSMRTPWPRTDRKQRINASSFHSWGKMVLSCISEDPSENPDEVDFSGHEQHKNMSLFGFFLFHCVFCKLATWNPIQKMLPMHKLSSQILFHGKSA